MYSSCKCEIHLCRQDLDWASIYMIPRMVTVESKLRIFQYKLLHNILYLNDRLYKVGIVQTLLCSRERSSDCPDSFVLKRKKQ